LNGGWGGSPGLVPSSLKALFAFQARRWRVLLQPRAKAAKILKASGEEGQGKAAAASAVPAVFREM